MKWKNKQWNKPFSGEGLVDLPVFVVLAMMIIMLTSMIYSNTLPVGFDMISEQTDVIRLIMSTVPAGVKWPIYLAFFSSLIAGGSLLVELHLQNNDA